MKVLSNKLIAVILVFIAAAACAVALILGRNTSVVTVRCLEGTPVYDYACENGYDIYPYYSYNHFDFTVNEDEFKFELVDGAAVITDYTGTANEIYIPETLGGAEVKAVSAATFDGCDVKTLYIPKCVTKMECRFSSTEYDADVKCAVFFSVVSALLGIILLLRDGAREQSGALGKVPFSVCCSCAAGVQFAVMLAAAVADLPALFVIAAGVILLGAMTAMFFISKKKNAE